MNDIDITDCMLQANLKLIPLDELHRLITEEYGTEQASLFGDLALFERIPEDPEPLIEFFTGRNDAISVALLAKLTETKSDANS